MNRSRGFRVWTSGILVVVCLLLSGLVRQFRKGPRHKPFVADLAGSVSVVARTRVPSRQPNPSRRIDRAVVLTPPAKSRLNPQARAARHPVESKPAMNVVLSYPSKAGPQAVSAPQPKTVTLQPLGYVQKADGRVEAVISLEDRVHVVHEGETIEDNFKVTKVSSSAVELVENLAPPAGSQLTAEMGQGGAPAPASQAPQMSPRPVPEVVSNSGPHRQLAAGPAAGGSQPSADQELGYVEKADGRVEAIVDEGEHVRLAPATKSFASNFHPPARSPANSEVANTSPPPVDPPDSYGGELQPVRPNSSTREAGGPPLIASGPEPPAVKRSQGVPADNVDSESEPLGILQPESLADYSGSRFEPRDIAPVPHTEPAGATPSPATAGSGQAPRGGATPSHSARPMGIHAEVSTLGYVESANGEKEAIVEVSGELYLVHVGELFAEKYRALRITSSSVEIVEEPSKRSSVPSN